MALLTTGNRAASPITGVTALAFNSAKGRAAQPPFRITEAAPGTGHAWTASTALAFPAPRVPTSPLESGRVVEQQDGADQPRMAPGLGWQLILVFYRLLQH